MIIHYSTKLSKNFSKNHGENTDNHGKKGKRSTRFFLVATFCLLIFGGVWSIYQYNSITSIGEKMIPQQADVIIILGAAVWQNGPSPALSARVEHAAQLYHEGYGSKIILSGGLGTYPPTEAQAMKEIMLRLGVKESDLFLEELSTRTRENLFYSKEIMEQQDWRTAIIVTDTFHIKRALLLAKDIGINAYGAPVKETILYRDQKLRLKYTIREVLAITQYYLEKYLFR